MTAFGMPTLHFIQNFLVIVRLALRRFSPPDSLLRFFLLLNLTLCHDSFRIWTGWKIAIMHFPIGIGPFIYIGLDTSPN